MSRNRIALSLLTLVLAVMSTSCNLPSAAPTEPGNQAPGNQLTVTPTTSLLQETSVTFTPVATLAQATGTATATFTPTATPCNPTVVANTPVNVRSGPGTVYDIVGALLQGGSANVEGKNAEGTWWYIAYTGGPGNHGWVAGSVVTASCIPATVAVIAAPPTPLPPSGTCKDNHVWRLIRPSDKVCVSPSSKAQADADNAAASSRLVTATYGPDTCASGYVWREAYSSDHVCVTAAVRSQAAADNAAASTRWVPGAYGPHTCVAGFVWREATSGDDVCVTPDVRTQTASDNAAASSRLATAAFGPDTCASGYVWREAFSGDHICVTPDVKNQVAADNAAAPSHTWP
jgi:uncharacterized protein YraI